LVPGLPSGEALEALDCGFSLRVQTCHSELGERNGPKEGNPCQLVPFFCSRSPAARKSCYFAHWLCWRLAGGTTPFIRRYSTICP
jgi:hypothetical protein